ncbi:biotin synthase auxiliary protein BsaP [Williamsia sp. SKLECPSW1]
MVEQSTGERDAGAGPITPLTEPLAFGVYTGVPVDAAVDQAIPEAARLGLEPPRFCGRCGRRMVVQVVPTGWTARCSRHGHVDSSALGGR